MTDSTRKAGLLRRAALKVEVMKLAARRDGTSVGDYEKTRDASDVCEQLVAAGLLFKVKFSHKIVRYYADKRMADALKHVPNKSHISIKPRQSANWSPDTPAVITKDTKFTVCPSPSVDAVHRKQVSNW
jgi:hypothetical protein